LLDLVLSVLNAIFNNKMTEALVFIDVETRVLGENHWPS